MRWNPAKAGLGLMFLLIILSGCTGARGPDCSERIVVHLEWMDARLFDLVKPPGPPGTTIQSHPMGTAGPLNQATFGSLNESQWLMGLAEKGFDFRSVTYFGEDGIGPAFGDFWLSLLDMEARLMLDKRAPEADIRRQFMALLQNVTTPSPQDEAALFQAFWESEAVGENMFGDRDYRYSVALPNASGVETLYLRQESQGLARPLSMPQPGLLALENAEWSFGLAVPSWLIRLEGSGTTSIRIDTAGQVVLRNFNYDRTFADTYRVLDQAFRTLGFPMPAPDSLIVWKGGGIRCPPEPIA